MTISRASGWLVFPASLCLLVVVLGSVVFPCPGWSAEDESGPAAEIRRQLDQAKKFGAKGQLPMAYWDLDSRLDEAEKYGAGDKVWATMATDVRRLLNSAEFIQQMRSQKSGMEALLGRFDQALAQVAVLYGVQIDPVLSGTSAAEDLLAKLGAKSLQRQVQLDSLMVVNRGLSEISGGYTAAQDSMITALQVEVSALRKELWETQLRVGVAEADRSAAESVLTAKQQREEAIAALRSTFKPEEAEILLTPAGGAILRVFGIAFAVGSSELQADQSALLARVADVIKVFPGAALRVEGHTDNTGNRQANLRLSRRRAEAVARALERNLDLGEGLVATEGFGPDRPLALNDSPAGRKLNRRIDVIIDAQD
ncbi:MAG: OmpA family protein [Gemmatimonadales bacterium]|nr:OmpA family protein [Gemmatimonadales bacterium]